MGIPQTMHITAKQVILITIELAMINLEALEEELHFKYVCVSEWRLVVFVGTIYILCTKGGIYCKEVFRPNQNLNNIIPQPSFNIID